MYREIVMTEKQCDIPVDFDLLLELQILTSSLESMSETKQAHAYT